MDIIDLKGKIVLITGGGSGAGCDIVRAYKNTGCTILFTYNNNYESALELKEELEKENIKVELFKYDQSDLESIKSLINYIKDKYNRIDILVNNAGIYPAKQVDEITSSDWDSMMDTNLKGVFFLSREAYNLMKEKGGSIVNISSINGTNPASHLVHYGISKKGIEMLTKCLAVEFGPSVRVNCIAPGLIYKEGQEKFIPGWRESYISRAPLKRLVNASEIGKACLFFSSDLSSAITGQTLTVDCGIMLSPCFDNSLRG